MRLHGLLIGLPILSAALSFWEHEKLLREKAHPLIVEEMDLPVTVLVPLATPSYGASTDGLAKYADSRKEGTAAKKAWCKKHGYHLYLYELGSNHPEWTWALRPEGQHFEESPWRKHFVSRVNRTPDMTTVVGRHAKQLAVLDFYREHPDYLGWLLMVDADTFIGDCSRSLLPFQLQMITAGREDRIDGGSDMTQGLWPKGAAFSYKASLAKDRDRWGTAGVGRGDLAPWSELLNWTRTQAPLEWERQETSEKVRFPSMSPDMVEHLQDWKHHATPSQGGSPIVLSPRGTPWLERALVGIAEQKYSSSGALLFRATTPQRRRRVEFLLRRWWELATDDTYSHTSYDQAAIRAMLVTDYIAASRNVTPVPMQALACQRMPYETSPLKDPHGAAIWHRCIERWIMALGYTVHAKPGDPLPKPYVDGTAFSQAKHAQVKRTPLGKLHGPGEKIAHNLANANDHAAPMFYFHSWLRSATGARHDHGYRPPGATELHCAVPSPKDRGSCMIMHPGHVTWNKWKGKMNCVY